MNAKEQKYVRGPFGRYPVGSFGEILNTLVRYYKVPLRIAEAVTIGNTISYQNKIIANYNYAPDSERSTIVFVHEDFLCYNNKD